MEAREGAYLTSHQDGARAWGVAIILMLCLLFSNMDQAVLALLIVPIERQFGLNDTALGLLQGTAFGLFYATFGLILSRAADNWHRRNLILVGLVVWSLATALCGLAIGPKTLFLGRVMVAVGEAVLMPAGVSMLADYFSPHYRTRALATYSMGAVLGGPLALVLGGVLLHRLDEQGVNFPLVGHLEGWRVVFLAPGIGGLFLVPLMLWVKEPPRLDGQSRMASGKLTLPEVMAVFRRNRVALGGTILGFALIQVGAASTQSWLPTLFVRVHEWTNSSVGLRFGLLSGAIGLVGLVLGGFLSDGLHSRGHLAGKQVIAAGCAASGAVAAVVISLPVPSIALAGAILLFLVMSIARGLAQAAIAQLLPNRARGLGTSMFVATTNILIATCGPLAIGVLTDHVFHDPMALPMSIRIVAPAMFIGSALALLISIKPYREGVLRQGKEA